MAKTIHRKTFEEKHINLRLPEPLPVTIQASPLSHVQIGKTNY